MRERNSRNGSTLMDAGRFTKSRSRTGARLIAALLLLSALGVVGSGGIASAGTISSGVSGTTLLADSFGVKDSLITNEYAFWNPGSLSAVRSTTWDVTSGSLLARNGMAWSGVPDAIEPDANSSNGTDSAIFRLVTKRKDFGSVNVSFRLRHNTFSSTPATPAVAWDGEHVFLRYVDESSLYSVSFNRRDGTTAIKKKVPGGSSNGGTYFTLAAGRNSFSSGGFHNVRAMIFDNPGGSVSIRLRVDGVLVLSATDSGTGGPVIRSGAVGIRGDNSDFNLDDFVVTVH
ncbi:MAG: hypothetical protein F2520_02125 [Actinobacteria bacterium]|uniref:Unannotated protein n=1 Tax=freshwater metagenome TaxID=449393 RepID=A0A6J5YE76_9ZZZZ|nr:hypothetical protein [Actinomycetota bacterium]